MSQNLKVSVCMITYNHENFIREAIIGVLIQECDFELELIIANDCSLDSTDNMVRSMIEKHPRGSWIRYIKHENNIGMMSNFIFALQQCKGKYIALCEGDDYWTDPLKLQKQVDFLESNGEYAGCFHYTQTVLENDGLGRVFGFHDHKLDFIAKDTFSTESLFHTSSFVFFKSSLEVPNWLSKVVSGDMAIFSIIAGKGKLRCLPEQMSIYRKHEGGITNTPNILNNYNSQRIELITYLNEFHDFKYQKKADEIIEFHRKALNTNSKKGSLIQLIIRQIKKAING